jgi:hypothetical protein
VGSIALICDWAPSLWYLWNTNNLIVPNNKPDVIMSQRLSNIRNTLTASETSRLQQARKSAGIDGQELKDVIFG